MFLFGFGKMTLKNYYFLGLYALLAITSGACREQDLPHASKLYVISSKGASTASRRFEKCIIHYAFVNNAQNFDVMSQVKSLEEPFDYWETAAGYINFVRVTGNDVPDVRFVFSDTSDFTGGEFDQGLIVQQMPELSKFIPEKNGTYTVVLNNAFRWDLPTLQRVLLFQVGTALGLPASTVAGSAMSPKLWVPMVPDSSDVLGVRRLYDQPCDEWVKLDSLPFGTFLSCFPFTLKGKGYVINDMDWSTWEYDPAANSWQQRKPFPHPSASWVRDNLNTFVIGDHAYIGADNFTGGASRQFWRYQPATALAPDRWDTIAPLPYKSIGRTGLGFGMGELGYVYTAVLDDRDPVYGSTSNNGLWVYDPKMNTWALPDAYINPTGRDNDLLYRQAIAVGNRAFIIAPGSDPSYLFDPAKPAARWSPIPPTKSIVYTAQVFAARDSPYMISGWFEPPKNVRRYEANGVWTTLKDMNANGRLAFCFTINDRVYVATDTREFWTYRP